MIRNLKWYKIMWLLVASMSLVAALTGVFYQNVYSRVLSPDMFPGTISQDLISIIAGLVLFFFSLIVKENETKKQIVVLSLLAYFFYGYSIYVIEQLYNSLYILYMVIVALSFWSLVFGLVNINKDIVRNIRVSKPVKYLTIGFLIFIPLLFYPLWIGQLSMLIKTAEKIEFKYSIFILDMVFILPAFIISAVMIIKKKALGFVFAPILFFKAFTLLFPVGLGEFLRPLYNQRINLGESFFYIALSIIFLALAILNFWNLKFQETKEL